jgi:hypothetical protein
MRSSISALMVVLMLVGSTIIGLAATPGSVTDEPDFTRVDPTKEPKIIVGDVIHYLDDQDGDKLFDSIQIVTKLTINTTGDFVLTTKLSPRDGSWWLSTQEPFSVEDDVEMPMDRLFASSFEGWKLYKNFINGFLVVTTEVTNTAGSIVGKGAVTLDGQFQYTQFEPLVAGASVTGIGTPVKLDFDGDKLYEIVEIPVMIDATTPGLYRIVMTYRWLWPGRTVGDTTLAARYAYQTVTNESTLVAGQNVVPMWISGGHVMSSDNITLWVNIYKSAFAGRSFSTMLLVENKSNFTAPSNLIYDRRHVETGEDTDGDHLFDLMNVRTGLDVIYPGEYSFIGVLMPSGAIQEAVSAGEPGSYTDIINRFLATKKAARDTWKGDLLPGRETAEFYFDGRLINAWGHDGTFELHVFWTGPAAFIGYYYKVVTIEFKASDFVHPVPPLEFAMAHSDEGVSRVGADLYDGLEVTYNVYVNIPGTYTAFAILYQEGKEVAYARTEVELKSGPDVIRLVFPGQAIAQAQAQGEFTSIVWVQGAGYDWNDTTLVAPMSAKHDTRTYTHDQFKPPIFEPGPKDPQPVEDLTSLLLKTGIISVRIDRNKPDLTFYMAEDEGRTALFRVLFTRLLAFQDTNGDGAPQAREITYTSALLSYDWDMTQVSLVEDPETGRVASFSLSTVIDLVEHDVTSTDLTRPLSTIREFARLTLVFSLASEDKNLTDEVGTYTILGGAELKVDVHIEVMTPVDGIDFLTLEQNLRDDRDRYRPRLANAADGEPTEDVSPYEATSDLKQRVEFVKRSATPAFYSWVKKAEVTGADGTTRVIDVQAAYLGVNGRMLLYLSYPYDVNTSYIFHDPSLGIYEGGFPGIPDEWKEIFDPLLFGVSALAAVAMVVALRSRGGREEEMDYEEEDVFTVEEEQVHDVTPETGPVPTPTPPVDGIEALPEEPQSNGSTILLQPPPTVPGTPSPGHDPEEWSETRD